MLGQASTTDDFVCYSPFGIISATMKMTFVIMVSPYVLDVCGCDAVKVRQAAPKYRQSRAELGSAIRSSVNSFLDPVRVNLSVRQDY